MSAIVLGDEMKQREYKIVAIVIGIALLFLSFMLLVYPASAITLQEIKQYVEPYPVGGVYITMNNINPSEELGYGEWVRIAQGKVLIGVDEANTAYSQSGLTGGNYTTGGL